MSCNTRDKSSAALRLAAVGLCAVALAACGTGPKRPDAAADAAPKMAPQDAVKMRAIKRWDLLIERRFDEPPLAGPSALFDLALTDPSGRVIASNDRTFTVGAGVVLNHQQSTSQLLLLCSSELPKLPEIWVLQAIWLVRKRSTHLSHRSTV